MTHSQTKHRRSLRRSALACLLAATSAAAAPVAQACTSLLYHDMSGAPYAGRTMELPMELPYEMAYVPVGTSFGSKADQHHVLDFTAKHAFVSIGVNDPMNGSLKITEGVNDKGLSFGLLAFASTKGPADMVKQTQAVLAAIDLGAWTLSQFGTVAEVKKALEEQAVLVTALLPLGLMKTPFHYTLHDASGASIVIEFANGKQQVHDNPVGVMTNGPEFQWHMTNLDNYTFLSNKDQSTITLNGREFSQPDSGIATVALPASNTSVGRFVRAVYYSQFAEKGSNPTEAMQTLAHVMNNFDRPRGITIDERFKEQLVNMAAPGVNGEWTYTSEYTSWTSLIDLRQQQMFVRPYYGINYVRFDLKELGQLKQVKKTPLKDIVAEMRDGSAALIAAK